MAATFGHLHIYDNNAFYYAVQHGHLEIVKFLIEKRRCPPDIIGQHNTIPLQMARFMNHSDIHCSISIDRSTVYYLTSIVL